MGRVCLAWLAIGWLAAGCSDDDVQSGGDVRDAAPGADASSPAGDASARGATDAIDARIERLYPDDPPFGTVDRALVRAMLELPAADDGPFFMVSFVQHRERALYADGRPSDLTGVEADALHAQALMPILLDMGARLVFVAEVEATLQADDDARFDRVDVVRYPSRAAFFDMLERDDYREALVHHAAGVETSLVMPAVPTDDEWPPDLRQVDLEAVPYPPTEDDMPIRIVHLYGYRDLAVYPDGRETELTGEEAVALYTAGREAQGVQELGVRPGLWLDIEGVLVGDDREFDEFRTNLFPSRATFLQVAATGQEAGIEHRMAGLEHFYTLMATPTLDEYAYEPVMLP